MSVRPEWLAGMRAAVLGAGREGVALTRYLCWAGAQVTLIDAQDADALHERLARLDGCEVRLALGGAPVDLGGVDVLFVSPGVPPTEPMVTEARSRGLPLSSEPRLFTQLCPAPIVGVTGSSGKTTTVALCGEMLAASGRAVWVGGNIGTPLIERLMDDQPADVVVMELSSFQLQLFSPAYQGAAAPAQVRGLRLDGWSPTVAAITNITPNHLDRHVDMAEYASAKEQIITHQGAGDWAVLNRDDALCREITGRARARTLLFSLCEPVTDGAYLFGDTLMLAEAGAAEPLCARDALRLRGLHNVANVLAAACCARAAGVPPGAVRDAATAFAGVPHRLELVRQWRGVCFVNDSIATSPERAMAAIRAYDEPLVLLAGGRDKALPWEAWADLVHARVRVVVAFGEAAPVVAAALARARERLPEGRTGAALITRSTLEEAVRVAAQEARPGEVVLLSPGGTSFDAYAHFEERGEHFCDLVAAL